MFNTNWLSGSADYVLSAVKTHYVATVEPVTEGKGRALRRNSYY